ncbi:hypothetical protein B0H15DRAFT_803117 [Mycena belliarum]|uniref:phytol kinase n=1 Tax=Mycena belliarum TaxID=1033014 RepID=A0AAD6TZ46_9AGAR|nr:hypothetical protein B0H15DRAFT_803117 [Mycena belliae]
MSKASAEECLLLLPVYFANLDSARVPDQDTFDTEATQPEVQDQVWMAVQSLAMIHTFRIPTDISRFIWPHVWPWMQFIALYRDYLPDIPPYWQSDSGLRLRFLMFLGDLGDDTEMQNLMCSTPGVYYMVAKAWPHVVPTRESEKRGDGFNDLYRFLANERAGNPANLAEIVDGAGGTLEDLAILVVSYIDALVPQDGAMDPAEVLFFSAILEFIPIVDPQLTDDTYSPMSVFTTSLLSQSIVRALASAIRALSITATQKAMTVLHQAFVLFGLILRKSVGSRHIPEALNHGVLYALASSWESSKPDSIHLTLWLTMLLPPALVYLPVVGALDRALANVADIIDGEAFKASPTHKLWDTLITLTNERLAVYYHLGKHPPMRACDNGSCSKMAVKTVLKRCRGCQSVYYCSRTCQSRDWHEGGHRAACSSYGTLSLTAQNDRGLTTRDRSFLRALVHHESHRLRLSILFQQTQHMRMFPGAESLVLYDYTWGPVKIKVLRARGEVLQNILNGAEWEDIVARVARSGGCVRLDVVLMRWAGVLHCWAIPLRRNSSVLYEGVQQIARKLPADVKTWDVSSVLGRLQALIDDEPNGIVEVH